MCPPFFMHMTTGIAVSSLSGTRRTFSWWKISKLLPGRRLTPSPMETALMMDSTLPVRIIVGEMPWLWKSPVQN